MKYFSVTLISALILATSVKAADCPDGYFEVKLPALFGPSKQYAYDLKTSNAKRAVSVLSITKISGMLLPLCKSSKNNKNS